MYDELALAVRAAGVRLKGVEAQLQMDMNYTGQTHSISVDLPQDALQTDFDQQMIARLFEKAYQRSFSRLMKETPIKVINLRVAAIGKRPKVDLSMFAPARDASLQAARRPSRKVWHEGQWQNMEIYSRLDLPVDSIISGPAILEQDDATILVATGYKGRVDNFGNLIISRLETP